MKIPKTAFRLALATLGLAGAASCALAESNAESRPLSPFSKVQISSGASAEIVCGSPAHAVVTSDSPGGIERTKTDVDDDTLSIRFRGMGSWSGTVKVVVTTPNPLGGVHASSGSSLRIHPCAVSPSALEISANSGGSIRLGGKTQSLEIHVSSGGRVEPGGGDDLSAVRAEIEASSGGSVRLCKLQSLEGHASSGGFIQTGEATHTNLEVSSGGFVSKRGCD